MFKNTTKLISVLERENKKLLEERNLILQKFKELQEQKLENTLPLRKRIRFEAVVFIAAHNAVFDTNKIIMEANKLVRFILGGKVPGASVQTLRDINVHQGDQE